MDRVWLKTPNKNIKYINKVPYNNIGNLNRTKVLSFPKSKLKCLQKVKNTLSEHIRPRKRERSYGKLLTWDN